MLEVTDKHDIRCCVCLNGAVLDHCPRSGMPWSSANWDYMAHGFYNTRPIYGLLIEQERTYWRDMIANVKKHTGQAAERPAGRGRRQHRQHAGPDGRVRLITTPTG